jgi:hypothetical protein
MPEAHNLKFINTNNKWNSMKLAIRYKILGSDALILQSVHWSVEKVRIK